MQFPKKLQDRMDLLPEDAQGRAVLLESQELYRTLFNSIDEGFCLIEMLFDPAQPSQPVDYRFIEINPSFERHTGLQSARGKTMRQLVPDHERYWFEIYGQVALNGHSARFRRHAAKLGRWYDVYAFRVGDPSKRQVGVLFTDITDQKALEDASLASKDILAMIVENAREFAIFSMDLERRVSSWNTGAERLFGYSKTEILGKSADIIFTDEDRAAGAPEREAVRAQAEGKAVDERWHMRKDGTRLWGSGFMMALRGPNGDFVGLSKILHDRTDQKHFEGELARSRTELEAALKEAESARREAESAAKTKDHFLAILSHELRTPLTPVLMTAESLLKRKDLPARAVEGLQMICRNIEIETHFIDDLLDITRIARGKFQLERAPLDVHEAIRSAIQICEADFATKGQKLILKLSASEREILGDPARVQQVFWNLLKNAVKFTPDNGTVTVETHKVGSEIVITVTDNGIGIDPARLVDIFDPFLQGDTSIARRFGGLGLGLAIAKATVEALEGGISATSKGKNLGSSFEVRLPLSPRGPK